MCCHSNIPTAVYGNESCLFSPKRGRFREKREAQSKSTFFLSQNHSAKDCTFVWKAECICTTKGQASAQTASTLCSAITRIRWSPSLSLLIILMATSFPVDRMVPISTCARQSETWSAFITNLGFVAVFAPTWLQYFLVAIKGPVQQQHWFLKTQVMGQDVDAPPSICNLRVCTRSRSRVRLSWDIA